jgi:hypothetical protein
MILSLFIKYVLATETARRRMRRERNCSITSVCNARKGDKPIADWTSRMRSPSANHFEATSWEMG